MGLDDGHMRQARSMNHSMHLSHIQVSKRPAIDQRQFPPRCHEITDSTYVSAFVKQPRQSAFVHRAPPYSTGGNQSDHLIVAGRVLGLGYQQSVNSEPIHVLERFVDGPVW
jgi:hypothetical protein